MKAELRHDSLASRIYAKASSEEKALRKVHNFIRKRYDYYVDRGVLMGKADFAYVNPYLDQLFLNEEEQDFLDKSQRTFSNRRRLIRVGVVLGILFLNFVAFSIYQWKEAESFAELAGVRVDSAKVTKGLIAEQVVLIEREKEKVEGLTQTIELEKIRVDSLKEVAIVLADSARKAEKRAGEQKKIADASRLIYEAAEIRIQEMSDRSQALFMLSEATTLLDSGDIRLAFLMAEQAYGLFEDSLSSKVLQEIAQSRIQYSLSHTAALTATQLSVDQKTLLTGSEDGEIRITQLFTPTEPVIMRHTGAIHDLNFSADNSFVLSASQDGRAILWNLQGQKVQTFDHKAAVNRASFTEIGNILTASDDYTAKLWDRNGTLIKQYKHKGKVSIAIADISEKFILTASDDQTGGLWTRDGTRIGTFEHEKAVTHAMFSPQQGLILTASTDGMVKLWSRDEQKLLVEIQHEASISSIGFRSDFEDDSLSAQLLIDRDEDGIIDWNDQESNTFLGAPVNKFGVALDSDEDGVIDLYDKENYTPWGAGVDSDGRAYDMDKDGVIDLYDLEKDTPYGYGYPSVNMLGIARDSDGDKFIDLYDEEPNTPRGLPTDRMGVTLDTDSDGVSEFLDKEPNTPKGAKVDFWGRAIDSDKDGVIDLYDKELSSAPNARVNKEGITDSDGDRFVDGEDKELQSPERAEVDGKGRADNDLDGFPDTKDQEWYTPETAEIDRVGGAVDTDKDGFPDLIDFQVKTPAEFRNQVDAFGREPGYPGDSIPPKKLVSNLTDDKDNDGVPDLYDKEPDTPVDSPIDSQGRRLALDSDRESLPQFIFTASSEGVIKVIDFGNAVLEYQVLAPARLSEASFFNEKEDYILAVSSLQHQVMLLNSDGEVMDFMPHPSKVQTVHIFRNKEILTGAEDGILRIWSQPFERTDPLEIMAHYRKHFAPLTQKERSRFRIDL